jgi:hypothetical protein
MQIETSPLNLTAFDVLLQIAGMDIERTLEEVFSGVMGFNGMPSEVENAAQIRIQLLLRGFGPDEIDDFLRETLQEHLVVMKHFAQLWIQPEPEPLELIEVWKKQAIFVSRWQLFIDYVLDSKESLEKAYSFAKRQDTTLEFLTEADKTHWMNRLASEQRADYSNFIHLSTVKPVLSFEGAKLYYWGHFVHLKPTEMSCLKVLWDELHHGTPELIREVYGQRNVHGLSDNLSKLIYALNSKLARLYKHPERKHWIMNVGTKGETRYKLTKPPQNI